MFRNRTIVITGSARGIGKVTAKNFLNKEATVIVSDLDPIQVEKTVHELLQIGKGKVFGKLCDVRDKAQVKELAEFAFQTTGRLDVWINNAGIIKDDLLLRMSEEKWNEVFDVNLRGAFFGTQAAAKYMIKQEYGRIINIGSVSGFYGNGGQANYSSAKAGLMTLTKSSARELASRNVTVNCVASGFIDNDFAANVPKEAREKILDTIPLKIDRNPEEAVSSAIHFFASEEADWITGATLRVDGGMMIGF
ncbi:3-oxoacyl-ACP reductase FabG [Leptospira sp. FAT2]|uniref:3-oxoacyl-ACP reductase FabG n=1 Tax=Leptospira sanjuanensis TaxID=2879643 RepID=UPI001EE7A45E|nr:3-oxoacyl-ACP reductase FabG [Leptospira sanjuanensis]MCG6168836.1 3-oxoacyl-ACP reductase FabG [Leptospira sanjuanensis]MCG6194250.1 3-oxoacyl-ACP reductase FabG [Leptospira sanjuanensis]